MDRDILAKAQSAALPVLTLEQIELVDLVTAQERGRLIIRFLIDKPGGITLNECARLNQEIGRLFEENNIINQSYVLEVASPGLDRLLKTTRDFQRCLGQPLRVVLHQPQDGQNVWVGRLCAVEEDKIAIQIKQQDRFILRENIAWARLEVLF